MKKFYSIVLMATMLLIGTNTWADVHSTQVEGDEAKVQVNGGAWQYASKLKEAFDAVGEGQTGNIALLMPISIEDPITMPAAIPVDANGKGTLPQYTGQNITLNLAGYNITTASPYVTPFRILKGSLDIEGNGMITKQHTNTTGEPDWYGGAVIAIAGSQEKTYANWSSLTIGQGVILNFETETYSENVMNGNTIKYHAGDIKKAKTIALTNFAGFGWTGEKRDEFTYKYNSTTSTLGVSSAQDQINKFGYCTRAVVSNVWQGTEADHGTVEGIPAKCGTTTLPLEGGALSSKNAAGFYTGIQQGCAFGVKVTIKGTIIGSQYGIHVHGQVNQTPQVLERASERTKKVAPYYTYQYPYVKIEKTASVRAANLGGCIGVYAAGYAVWDIEGNVAGASGVYMKAGDIELKDAVVESTYSGNTWNWGTNGDGGVHGAGGSAVVVESSDAYAGNSGIVVEGDSKLTGGGGYAILDQTTISEGATEGDKSTTSHVTIEGGTIEGGTAGAINIAEGTVDVTTIAGGNVDNSTVTVTYNDKSTDEVEVTSLLTEGTHTTIVKDENDKDIVVISKGVSPTEYVHVYGNPKDSVKWIGSGDDAKETLVNSLTLKELEINQSWAQVLTVPSPMTLTVGRVVLGKNAQIVVEPGAKFIVTGKQGIVAPSVDNILLESSEAAQATFLFNPAVTSNREPNATVNMTVAAGVDPITSEDIWTRFALPVKKQISSWTKKYSSNTWLYQWDYEANGGQGEWAAIPGGNINMKPWTGYTLSNNRSSEEVYTMKGALVGNNDASLNFVHEGYNYFGNSYSSYLDARTLVEDLTDGHIDRTVYMWNSEDQQFHSVTKYRLQNSNDLESWEKDVAPMQTFILQLRGGANSASESVDYEDAIWKNPRYGKNGTIQAPRREQTTTNTNTFIKMEITSANGKSDRIIFIEGADFSDAYESGYDASKFFNEGHMSIYASIDGENYSDIATNSLEGKTISMQTLDAVNYTLSFKRVNGQEYAIRDNVTGAVIAIEEGASYEFAAQPNSVAEGRFEIVKVSKVATDIENTEVKANAKGIYTIMGQYVGEDFEALPAGIYVVDGVKIVK